jgi:hypothetical protein
MRRSGARALLAAATATLAAGCGGSGSFHVPAAAEPAVRPPAHAVLDAREWGTRDIAIARVGNTATVQVVDAQGRGVSGLAVRVDGRRAAPCGSGCYRARAAGRSVVVRVGSRSWRFDIQADAASGARIVASMMRAYARLHSARKEERLASSPTNAIETSFLFVAPDRLRYSIRDGSQAIVVGATRWDRPDGSGRWVRSAQDAVLVMRLPWARAYDARVVAAHTVTFFDPSAQAWFRVVFDPKTSLPRTVQMTGVSHFMTDRYSHYDAPAAIRPPPR